MRRNSTFKLYCAILMILPLITLEVGAQSNGNGVGKGLDKQVERQVARGVEKNIDKQVGRSAEKQVDRTVSQKVSNKVSKSASASVDKKVNENAASQATSKANSNAKNKAEKSLPDAALANSNRDKQKNKDKNPAKGNGKNKDKPQDTFAAAHEFLDIATDQNGDRYLRNQRVMLISRDKLQALQRNGVRYRKATELGSMKKVLVELDAENAQLASRIGRKYDKSLALNYVYSYQADAETTATDTSWLPNEALSLNVAPDKQRDMRIGLIDSSINPAHASLARANIETQSFVQADLPMPTQHGTAVASVLVGDDALFLGLLPDANIYSAGVFYSTPEGDSASLTSIVLAMDWLAQQNVSVVNMSLAGPGSMLLEEFVQTLSKRGIAIVAAAGNGGPGAKAAYPAAYPQVIAVTAVDRNNRVYYRASHGDYIDFAAPGVGLTTAASEGGYNTTSGTSYAAPFVSAVFASSLGKQPPRSVAKQLRREALDLGEPSRDLVYGYGMIRPIGADRLVYSE